MANDDDEDDDVKLKSGDNKTGIAVNVKSTEVNAAADDAEPVARRIAKAAVAFLLWMVLNISLSFSNKYLFVYEHYLFPLLIVIMGTMATFFGTGLMLLLRVDEFQWRLCM